MIAAKLQNMTWVLAQFYVIANSYVQSCCVVNCSPIRVLQQYDNRPAISGTRPKTENFKELGRSTLSHSLPPMSSSHSPLQSALLYRFFYHMHLLPPPLTSGRDSNLTKLYLIIVKNFRQRQVATCL